MEVRCDIHSKVAFGRGTNGRVAKAETWSAAVKIFR